MGVGFLSLPDRERDEDRWYPMNASIVIATYGDAKWLDLAMGRAYRSAVAETDSPKVVVHHSIGATLAQSRNTGASLTSGEWLCFLDADDELEPGYLAAMQAAAIAHAPVLERRSYFDVLLAPSVRYVRDGSLTEAMAAIPNRGKWPQTNECVIGTLVHRNLFDRVGGFRDTSDDGTPLTMYEDWDLWLRCWDAGAELIYADRAVYRAHGSTGGSDRNLGADWKTVYDAIWADHMNRPGTCPECGRHQAICSCDWQERHELAADPSDA